MWLPIGVVGGVALLFVVTLVWLVVQSRPAVTEARIVEPERSDIVLKTVATGAIVPRAEIEIKSRVSGVVHALDVEPGEPVEAGALIAEIQVIPDSATLNRAQSDLRAAKIEYDNANVEFERARSLSDRAALSGAEMQRAQTARDLAKQAYDAAWRHLQIVKDGASAGDAGVSTEIRSTVAGMVLAVEVEEGSRSPRPTPSTPAPPSRRWPT
ncbi:MAG: hypothetical protein R3F59_01215 [Myxococcota bacterium]